MYYGAGKLASWRWFWQSGAAYFFAFLKIALFFLLVALVWTALLWLPVLINLQSSLMYFPSEKYTVWLVFAVLLLWLTGLAVMFLWSV